MKKFAASIAKSKGIKPPRGYTRSAAVCRAFLDEHAPRRGRRTDATLPVGQAGSLATAHSELEGAEIGTTDTVRSSRRSGPRRPGKFRPPPPPGSRQGPRPGTTPGTPLRIPYGNKELAFALGARYGPAGWYAPRGVDLTAFRQRGWL